MKQCLALVLILGLGIASLIVVQRRHERTAASANAVINMMADAQRDTLRAPLHFTRLSDDEETRIGDEMAERYAMAFRTNHVGDDAIDRQVQRIGGRLAAHAHRKLRYRFHLIPDKNFLNAFALPGGHVFIGLGLDRDHEHRRRARQRPRPRA